jgi:hypothetical protein
MYTVPRARAQQERHRARRPERPKARDRQAKHRQAKHRQGEEPAGAEVVAVVDSPVVGRRSRLHPAPRT